MAEQGFLTPLPRLAARLIAGMLNRARELHHGKPPAIPREPLAINLQGLGFCLQFAGGDQDEIAVSSLLESQAETIINASPVSLALQAGSGQPGGRIEIQGNATLAQQWQQYFSALNPDWEQGLSQRLGPVLGYQLAQALQQCLNAAQTNSRQAADMLGEYLQEESRLLITAVEMQHFLDAVDDLAERADRLLARQAAR